MSAAHDASIFFCDQIGDRVRAIVSTSTVERGPPPTGIAASRLLHCSGAVLCGWAGPALGRASLCTYQLALAETAMRAQAASIQASAAS
jgi:hypothetical protein